MSNLVAYIPVINKSYLDWFSKYDDNPRLFLIPQAIAEKIIPALARNPAMMTVDQTRQILLRSKDIVGLSDVLIFDPENISGVKNVSMPNEDLSYEFSEKVLYPLGVRGFHFETIWARWDMKAIKEQQIFVPDITISSDQVDLFRIRKLFKIKEKSSDWWRQIACAVWRDDQEIAIAWNSHLPTEYEPAIFGDPRLNFSWADSGELAAEAYTSIHAERKIIALAARYGIKLEGSSLYVSTFPCGDCARWIVTAGIRKVFFFEGFSRMKGLETLRSEGIEIIQVVQSLEN